MKLLKAIGMTALLALLTVGCGGEGGETGTQSDSLSTQNGASENQTAGQISFEKNGLKVYALEGSPEYANATLALSSPGPGVDLPAGKNKFQFAVENFELGSQTSGAGDNGLANSDKGQHIHFILNNEPYHAHYGAEVEMDLKDGNYTLLAFLSRSYHESVKNPHAFVLTQFNAGQPESFKELDLNAPHMFYSRPKGEYKGNETKRLLLDFYLVNCTLSPEGYKVRATINGTDFMLTKWIPYVVEGLADGEVTVKLELLDAEGNVVNSPFNPVERKVTLSPAA